jgi:hypothetical protein
MLTLLVVYSFLFGAATGVVNDALKIFRKLIFGKGGSKAEAVVLFVEDLLLTLFIGCGVVVLGFYLNRGIFRWYTVAAIGVGFVTYYFTLGKLVELISDYIIRFLRFVALKIFIVVSYPIRALFTAVKKIIVSSIRKIAYALEKRRVMRYNKRKAEKLIAASKNGSADTVIKEEKNEI